MSTVGSISVHFCIMYDNPDILKPNFNISAYLSYVLKSFAVISLCFISSIYYILLLFPSNINDKNHKGIMKYNIC